LQRFKALAENQAQNNPQAFLQPNDVSAASLAAIDSLSQLLTRYEELRENSDKSENQSALDFEQFQRQNNNLLEVLSQTKNYKQSMRLQAMSDLDSDTEDNNALKSQLSSVDAYVARLRQACADVLEHYNERKERREENLQALQQARQVINVDNADEVHHELSNLAQTTDNEATALLRSSRSTNDGTTDTGQPRRTNNVNALTSTHASDLESSMTSLATFAGSFASPALPQPRGTPSAPATLPKSHATMESTNASILRDLRSLQDISDTHQQNQDGLNMLPAMR